MIGSSLNTIEWVMWMYFAVVKIETIPEIVNTFTKLLTFQKSFPGVLGIYEFIIKQLGLNEVNNFCIAESRILCKLIPEKSCLHLQTSNPPCMFSQPALFLSQTWTCHCVLKPLKTALIHHWWQFIQWFTSKSGEGLKKHCKVENLKPNKTSLLFSQSTVEKEYLID